MRQTPVSEDVSDQKRLSYEDAKRMAVDRDPEVRRSVAARTDITPEIIYFLSQDLSPDVRGEIAANLSTPRHADLDLAKDVDQSVRTRLAEKIGGIIPEITPDEAKKLGHLAYDALAILTRDQVTAVRQIIAEALRNVAHAPSEIVNQLARDGEIVVSRPILEESPVLTDSDLLEILSEAPNTNTLSAIARRALLGHSVADAVAKTGDIEAVGILLTNPFAQIREGTLDWVIEHAPPIKPWHAPLVNRPKLTGNAAMRIAQFVANNLLKTLVEREDLSKETVTALRKEVSQRLRDRRAGKKKAAKKPPKPTDADLPLWKRVLNQASSELDAAETLHTDNQLDAAAIMDALAHGEEDFVTAALAVKAGVPHGVAGCIVAMQNARGIVSLASRAEIPESALSQLQVSLCRVSPNEIVKSKTPGKYPMTEEEMAWQLEFFHQLAMQV